jgi:hypothetical protein
MKWEAYKAYRCKACREACINRFDDSATKASECRSCHYVPELESDNQHSEGEGEAARPAAQRSEQSGTTAERPEAVAPARPAGSDPLRVDPETRAHRDDRREDPSQRESPAGGPERGCGSGRGPGNFGDDWLAVETQ